MVNDGDLEFLEDEVPLGKGSLKEILRQFDLANKRNNAKLNAILEASKIHPRFDLAIVQVLDSGYRNRRLQQILNAGREHARGLADGLALLKETTVDLISSEEELLSIVDVVLAAVENADDASRDVRMEEGAIEEFLSRLRKDDDKIVAEFEQIESVIERGLLTRQGTIEYLGKRGKINIIQRLSLRHSIDDINSILRPLRTGADNIQRTQNPKYLFDTLRALPDKLKQFVSISRKMRLDGAKVIMKLLYHAIGLKRIEEMLAKYPRVRVHYLGQLNELGLVKKLWDLIGNMLSSYEVTTFHLDNLIKRHRH